ncbi:MAG: Maf family protein [Oleiphilus sp.]
MHKTDKNTLILASSSPYRKALLSKIVGDFTCASPHIDESRHKDEALQTLASRLATEKAFALSHKFSNHLIIGSDQVACVFQDGEEVQLTKPLSRDNCLSQLKFCRNKTVQFYTGLCLLNTASMQFQVSVERYETKFRNLTEQQLNNYIDKEPALDCAGGFKMEGLGISLFEHIRGDDPNSLIGLPLIKLIDMLENEGVSILGE